MKEKIFMPIKRSINKHPSVAITGILAATGFGFFSIYRYTLGDHPPRIKLNDGKIEVDPQRNPEVKVKNNRAKNGDIATTTTGENPRVGVQGNQTNGGDITTITRQEDISPQSRPK